MNKSEKALDQVLDGLMERYTERVPDVKNIINAMIKEGLIADKHDIENDHIAFRTLGLGPLGIRSLEKIFLYYGYQKRDHYYFKQKQVDAFWYAPPSPQYPRIFLSELRVNDLSADSQEIIYRYVQNIKSDPVDQLDLNDGKQVVDYLHTGLWQVPSLQDYLFLAKESEYAAWVIYNRYYLNHFTISVHNLKDGYNTIASFNEFLQKHGFILNDSGGKIKVSNDGALLQSSTVAQMVSAEFANNERMLIPGSYVEFAERKVLPQYAHLDHKQIRREHRREGFETNNADKIFESTYSSQTDRTLSNQK